MKNRRYIGTIPYGTDHQDLFFGRETDSSNLTKILNIQNLVVLFGKSGVGKTSLLNAYFIPKYCTEFNFRPIFIRFHHNYNNPKLTPLSIFVNSIRNISDSEHFLDQLILPSGILWQQLKKLQLTNSNFGAGKFLIILDQFEEFFNFPKESIDEFGSQLSNLISKNTSSKLSNEFDVELEVNPNIKEDYSKIKDQLVRPLDIKVLISIRASRLSELNLLRKNIPYILNDPYRLNALNKEQAKQIIIEPPLLEGNYQSPKYQFSENAIQKILDYFITDEKGQIVNQKFGIEPWQLQIICSEIERRVIEENLISDSAIIGENKIETDFKRIFKNYYQQDILGKIESPTDRVLAEKLIEDLLIIEDSRISRDELEIKNKLQINDELLDELVEKHILRRNKNTLGNFAYEISHDTLVAPILEMKNERSERLKNKIIDKQKKEIKQRNYLILGILAVSSVFVGLVVWNLLVRRQLQENQSMLKTTSSQLIGRTEDLQKAEKELDSIRDSIKYYNKLKIEKDSLSLLTVNLEDSLKYVNESYEDLIKSTEVAIQSESITGKSAEWFNTRERRARWWESLSNEWQNAYKTSLEDKLKNDDLDKQIISIFNEDILIIQDNSIKNFGRSGINNLTKLLQIKVDSDNLSSFYGFANSKVIKLQFNSTRINPSEVERYKKKYDIDISMFKN